MTGVQWQLVKTDTCSEVQLDKADICRGGDRRDHRSHHSSGPPHRHDSHRYGPGPRDADPYHDAPYRAGPRSMDAPSYDDPRYGPPAHYDAPHHAAYDAPPRDAYYGRPYSASSEYSGYGERPRTHDGYAPPARDPYYERPPRDVPAPAPGPTAGYSYGSGSGYGGAPDPYVRVCFRSALSHAALQHAVRCAVKTLP